MKPSEFLQAAKDTGSAMLFHNSVFKQAEHEMVFRNALVCCKQVNGDKWDLSKETYEAKRKEDGNYSAMESRIADEVLPYLKDYTSAVSFSAHGREIHQKSLE